MQLMPTQEFGADRVPVSRIALGCMGLSGNWNPDQKDSQDLEKAIMSFLTALDVGITFYDHADIYGGTACESIFQKCLAAVPGVREKIFIATKVGIRSGFYDHSPDYIRRSLEGSLRRLGVEYVDLYQLHRPDPLSHPKETAATLDALVADGRIRAVGVSNYYPEQVRALQAYLNVPIVSNQISLSLLRLDPVYEGSAGGRASSKSAGADAGDGVLDQCLALNMTPLAYSPLSGGWLSGHRPLPQDLPEREAVERLAAVMDELSPIYGDATQTQLALAWLLGHPAGIIPLVGSNNPAHIREAADAVKIPLSREDWYRLWVAARGERVP